MLTNELRPVGAEGVREMWTDSEGREWTDEQVNEAWEGAETLVIGLETELEQLRVENKTLRAWIAAELVLFDSEIDDKIFELMAQTGEGAKCI